MIPQLRPHVRPSDPAAVRHIVESSGFFRPDEVDIAEELVQERLDRGSRSGYEFLFADLEDRPVGYACFGRIGCTISSYDLYWLAVLQEFRGGGIGKQLLRASEATVSRSGGRRIYVETSSRPQYAATRGFYRACGYDLAAVLDDFYAPDDSKMIYVKILPPSA